MDPRRPKLKLSDVLGALVSSIASARSVADVEALRTAHRYHQNELLRGLPVPRLRFSRISVSVPIVVTGVAPGEPAEPAAPSIVGATAATALQEGLAALAEDDTRAASSPYGTELAALEDEEVVAAGHRRRRLVQAVSADRDALAAFEADFQRDLSEELLDLRQAGGEVPLSDAVIREAVRETSRRLVRRLIRRALLRAQRFEATEERPFHPEAARQGAEAALLGEPVDTLLRRVSEAAQGAAVTRLTEPAEVEVLVETEAIKNAGGGPGAVTQLHLTLVEEGLEWVGEDQRDGSRTWKLSRE